MSNADDLIPVFIPPLAACLAKAEDLKKAPLTAEEVVKIRNSAVCMMMAPEEAEKLTTSRGYRDVAPEDCWADWHRLRVQLTGKGYLPKIVLCLLGDADFESRARYLLESEGIEHEWRGRDARMTAAFEASTCRWDPSFRDEDRAAIASHSRALYVLSGTLPADEGAAAGLAFLQLGARLLEAGAVAMKCDSSGIAHGRDRWLELAREADGPEPWNALLRAFVQFPISTGDDYYSCGMHLLGQPDLIASHAILKESCGPDEDPGWRAVHVFGIFAHYMLAECQPGEFASGHTFSPDAESPRFRVQWEGCTGYDEDDFFFNPFGRWRFSERIA